MSPLMSNPISTCIFHNCQQTGDATGSCGDEALRGPHGLFFCHCGPRKLSEVAGIRPSLHLSKLHVRSSVVLANAARWSGCGFAGVSRTVMRPGPPCRRASVSHKAASPNIAVATAQAPRSLSRRRPSARDIAGYGLRHSAQSLRRCISKFIKLIEKLKERIFGCSSTVRVSLPGLLELAIFGGVDA